MARVLVVANDAIELGPLTGSRQAGELLGGNGGLHAPRLLLLFEDGGHNPCCLQQLARAPVLSRVEAAGA